MSSTFALSSTRPSGSRFPGLRRRSVTTPDRTFTLDALRALPGWTVLDSSPLSFVDHLVLTPAGVLAVTARYHDQIEGEDGAKRSWRAIRAARAAGVVLQEMLGDHAPTVTPVLMIWGPGAPELEDGHVTIKGVHVLDHRRPEVWAGHFAVPAMDEMTRRRAIKALRGLRNDDRAGSRNAVFAD